MSGSATRRANRLSRIALVIAGALGGLLVAWSGLASPLGDEQPPPSIGEPPPGAASPSGVPSDPAVGPSGIPIVGPAFLFIDAARPNGATPVTQPTVVRSRHVEVNVGLLNRSGGAPGAATAPGTELVLNLFPDVVLTAVFDRTETVSPPGYVWIGHLKGIDGSSVTLAVQDSVVIGNIRLTEQVYAVRFVGDGLHVVQEIDTSAFPPD